MSKILGVGNALVDKLVCLPNDDLLSDLHLMKGGMCHISAERYAEISATLKDTPAEHAPGGSASNTISALTLIDNETGFIAAVGDDEGGRFYRQKAEERGIHMYLHTSSTDHTGVAVTLISPDGERTFATFVGAAGEVSSCLDVAQEAFTEGYDILHVEGYIAYNETFTRQLLQCAHEAGLKVSLDLASWNLVAEHREYLHQLVEDFVDIVFANEEEAVAFTGNDDVEANVRALAALTEVAVVKVGKKGAWAMTHSMTSPVFCEAHNGKPLDTTAAGDFFAAGFLHAYARHADLTRCLNLGNHIAGEVIKVLGAQVRKESLTQWITKRGLCCLLPLLLCFCSLWGVKGSSLQAQTRQQTGFDVARNLETFADIYRQLDLFYVDSLSADTAIRWALDGMLTSLDPYTVYYPYDDQEALKQLATGKYAGIGALIRPYKKRDRTAIEEPYEGSPAQEAGVKAGDIILTIDGKDTKGWGNSRVSKALRGEPGTTFELCVERQGVPLTFKITRRQIQIPSLPWYGIIDEERHIGYLLLTSVTDQCAAEVRTAILEMKAKGMQRLIFDLRENPGGAISAAVEIVGMFVPKGSLVVSTKGKVAATCYDYLTPSEPLDTVMPLAVLVDGNSASAAEIISGALQDLDRAVILGQRTYGKGLVQAIRDVPYHGQVKMTTARYYIPSGRCIQAYDYRHRTADGAATTLPDSLTKVFYTRLGRPVRDGGGILPDSVLKADTIPSMVYDLVNSDAFFDFITTYVNTHETIAAAGEFRLSDEAYAAFCDSIQAAGDFKYNGRSVAALKQVKMVARIEGIFDRSQAEFEALEAKLNANDLTADLVLFRSHIQPFIEVAIVCRNEYQRGAVRQQLVTDTEVHKAIETLCDIKDRNQTTTSCEASSPLR